MFIYDAYSLYVPNINMRKMNQQQSKDIHIHFLMHVNANSEQMHDHILCH